jgi:tRNA threonylcarbamoyl adenosine modification protein (Sua5/YciO/YrdC/YwlC family)
MIHYTIHPVNPQRHLLERTVAMLTGDNAICVYPTDTVYGIGAPVNNVKALDRIGRILERDKARLFSFICCDFSQMSDYVKISNNNYSIMKHHLPGPFTFILPATHYVPKKVCPKRKTVGIRMPDCITCLKLAEMLGVPLANTSIDMPGHLRGDPDEVKPAVLNEVDVMLDIGMLENPTHSTIVDLTGDLPAIIREGKGIFNF